MPGMSGFQIEASHGDQQDRQSDESAETFQHGFELRFHDIIDGVAKRLLRK